MQTITIQMTLEEVRNACMIFSRADPMGVFTGALLKRIDTAARAAVTKLPPTPDNSCLQPDLPVVQSAEK
jgi:hypothetical protein